MTSCILPFLQIAIQQFSMLVNSLTVLINSVSDSACPVHRQECEFIVTSVYTNLYLLTDRDRGIKSLTRKLAHKILTEQISSICPGYLTARGSHNH